ncbi:hypothetical protein RvY_18043 [Ramazzottius varieornatus]|uniref:Uncharacterized protein n=1 Tax=Ramazzottius varieornatus TaxID=947166 RepID=A0A1D1W671_RAMVA|nr:hypothetical protein RvY_18043 [Ramazzottius varieornatus]
MESDWIIASWLCLHLFCQAVSIEALSSKEWIERSELELRSSYGETGHPCVILGPRHCYEYKAQCFDGICRVSNYQEDTPAEKRARIQQMLGAAQSSGCPYANMMANMPIEDLLKSQTPERFAGSF